MSRAKFIDPILSSQFLPGLRSHAAPPGDEEKNSSVIYLLPLNLLNDNNWIEDTLQVMETKVDAGSYIFSVCYFYEKNCSAGRDRYFGCV